MKVIRLHIVLLVLLFFTSCSNTKFLGGNQTLYTGVKSIKIEKEKGIKYGLETRGIIYSGFLVKPNNSLFGIPRRTKPPFGLWTYNYLHPKKDKGFIYWYWSTFSETPVLLSTVKPEKRALKLQNDLFNYGHFETEVISQLHYKKSNPQKALVSYKVHLSPAYVYNSVAFTQKNDQIDRLIYGSSERTLLRKGDFYNYSTLLSERNRISDYIKDHGYYYFKPDYVIYLADTSKSDHLVDIKINSRKEIPDFAKKPYSINEVNIYFENLDNLVEKTDSMEYDSVLYEDYNFYYYNTFVKPKTIFRNLFLEEDSLYSISAHNRTLEYLNNMGIYKYVNINYTNADSGKLNVQLNLMPRKKYNYGLKMNMVSKSTSFVGPAAEATFTSRNMFKSSANLSFLLSGGFEWFIGGDELSESLGIYSYEINAKSSLRFPRMLVPFDKRPKNSNLSNTRFDLGIGMLNRVEYFRMGSVNGGVSYNWKKEGKLFSLDPVRFNYVKLLDTTSAFNQKLNEIPVLKRSFADQFILSQQVSYTVDNAKKTYKTGTLYWKGSISSAGNVLSAYSYVSNGFSSPEGTDMVFGNKYAQYLKLVSDLRYYLNIGRGRIFAARLFTGVGLPYGNSRILPFTEQFFMGGPNSLRGFQSRSIGPGSYQSDDGSNPGIYIDQTGDLRMEINAEYRFRFGRKILGAVFVDGGNVWLINDDPDRPGGAFQFNSFVNDMALVVGYGLRVDLSMIVLRLDVGNPIRVPYLPNGDQWFAQFNNSYDIKAAGHFAIGYPF